MIFIIGSDNKHSVYHSTYGVLIKSGINSGKQAGERPSHYDTKPPEINNPEGCPVIIGLFGPAF